MAEGRLKKKKKKEKPKLRERKKNKERRGKESGLSWEDLLDKPEDLSDREPVSCERVRVVLDVTDVHVAPSSAVTEFCDGFACCSDWAYAEPQSFSFSKKRAHCCCADTQEEMRYEGSPVITPPPSRRRMTPPTPVKNLCTSFVRDHGRYEEEGRGWNARETTIIARTKQFLERSFSVKVRVEESEGLLGPEDVGVDFRRILQDARDKRGRNIFETFISDDLNLLVAEWSR